MRLHFHASDIRYTVVDQVVGREHWWAKWSSSSASVLDFVKLIWCVVLAPASSSEGSTEGSIGPHLCSEREALIPSDGELGQPCHRSSIVIHGLDSHRNSIWPHHAGEILVRLYLDLVIFNFLFQDQLQLIFEERQHHMMVNSRPDLIWINA